MLSVIKIMVPKLKFRIKNLTFPDTFLFLAQHVNNNCYSGIASSVVNVAIFRINFKYCKAEYMRILRINTLSYYKVNW